MSAGAVLDANAGRRNDLAKIHMAKAKLGWDDATYRDVMWAVCQVRSAGQLDFAGRKRFLDHLDKCLGQIAARPAKPVKKPLTRAQKKMWSLWQQLAEAGRVENRKMPALLAFVKRTTGVDRLEWLTGAQENLVIEALKKWLDRGEERR